MMFRALLLSTVLSACVALQMAAPLCRPQISGRAAVSPTMQFGFFGKKDKKEETPPATPKRRGGNFYDDEIDTVSRPEWVPDFADNGGDGGVDLATQGAGLYAAFIPFLLLFFAYTSGIFSFGYERGNF